MVYVYLIVGIPSEDSPQYLSTKTFDTALREARNWAKNYDPETEQLDLLRIPVDGGPVQRYLSLEDNVGWGAA